MVATAALQANQVRERVVAVAAVVVVDVVR
jgi:hypothetical protein